MSLNCNTQNCWQPFKLHCDSWFVSVTVLTHSFSILH
jgi:hypothetical protein